MAVTLGPTFLIRRELGKGRPQRLPPSLNCLSSGRRVASPRLAVGEATGWQVAIRPPAGVGRWTGCAVRVREDSGIELVH